MSRGSFFEMLTGVSKGTRNGEIKNEEVKKRNEERKKCIIKVCEVECANCDNWNKQKQCSSCEIFKALSEARKC